MTIGSVTTPLELKTPELGKISRGGYVIAYSGKIPTGALILLGVPDAANAIDVTHKDRNHLIDAKNRAHFLALIGKARWWGTKGRCRLFLKTGNSVVPASNEVTFDCPVKPLVCRPKLGVPTLGLAHPELDGLTYAAEDEHGNGGRFLHVPAIDGCYYFQSGKTADTFEVDNAMRGLVCTSYIGAVWGGIAATVDNPLTWTGCRIASCAGVPFNCADVGVTNRPLAEVKNFLEQHKNETFLVGSSSHIVLVARGVVRDFTNKPRRGYNCRTLNNWHPLAHVWTVGKPQLQF